MLPFQAQNIPTEGQQQTPAAEQETTQTSDQQQNQQQTGTQQQTSTTTAAPEKLPQQRYSHALYNTYMHIANAKYTYLDYCNLVLQALDIFKVNAHSPAVKSMQNDLTFKEEL